MLRIPAMNQALHTPLSLASGLQFESHWIVHSMPWVKPCTGID